VAEDNSEVLLELMGGMYIQMLRIYDLLALIAQSVPNADSKIDALIELHESGKVLAPDPALLLEDE
jgi:hypothetical protein